MQPTKNSLDSTSLTYSHFPICIPFEKESITKKFSIDFELSLEFENMFSEITEGKIPEYKLKVMHDLFRKSNMSVFLPKVKMIILQSTFDCHSWKFAPKVFQGIYQIKNQ